MDLLSCFLGGYALCYLSHWLPKVKKDNSKDPTCEFDMPIVGQTQTLIGADELQELRTNLKTALALLGETKAELDEIKEKL